jgi:hypothetical protein
MRGLRKLIGIVLLAAVTSLGVPAVSADGPQESPGVVGGPQESPGITVEIILYLGTALIP